MKPVGGLVEDRDVAGTNEVPAQRKEPTLPVGELVDPPYEASVAVEGEHRQRVGEELLPEVPFDARRTERHARFGKTHLVNKRGEKRLECERDLNRFTI